MGLTIAQKIIKAHLVSGEMTVGEEVALRIDQTLTQDATGTMAYLEFEAMGIPRVRTEKSVAYIDHNTLQCGFENADDHQFIGSIAKKHGKTVISFDLQTPFEYDSKKEQIAEDIMRIYHEKLPDAILDMHIEHSYTV